MREGKAARVIFYYPGEEGTYIDDVHVILHVNGIVEIKTRKEETTTHIRNCEIIWNCELNSSGREGKLRLLSLQSKSTHKNPD